MTLGAFPRKLATLLATLAVAGLLAAAFVRFAPGYGVDEQALDPRASHRAIPSLDPRVSTTFGIPVTQLLADRIPVTARLAVQGLLLAWTVGLLLAVVSVRWTAPWLHLSLLLSNGFLLCLPAALVALATAILRAPAALALAAAIFPKLFSFLRNVLHHRASAPHVDAARARGVGESQILIRHVVLPALPEIGALAGVSVSMALGAAVPIEAFCDLPGIGQLAWKAALGRDLPVLVALTLVVAAVTLTANTLTAGDFSRRAS